MSFGCSPSDVLKLLEISTRVYLAFKDANENSEAQVSGLVKEFTTFHTCLEQLGELMKQYGQPMPFPVKDFEDTLKKCEKTLEPYADHLVDRKMSVKKFIFTIRYIGMEKEIDGLRKQISGHYQALNMCISFLQLRLHLEATKQTQRLLDAAPSRTVNMGRRSYSTHSLGIPSNHTPLALAPPDEHPLFSEWKIFDRWLQSEDERIAQEAGSSRPLSLGDIPASVPSGDVQTAAVLYQLRRQVDDAILIEENRAKRATAEKRTHLIPSDTMKQEVRDMPPAPPRVYTLKTNHSGDFTEFGQELMSDSTATIRPSLSIRPSSPDYFGSFNWTQSPTSKSLCSGRTASISTTRSSECYSAGTTPEKPLSPTLQRSLSRTSLATMALGDAALDWKRVCRNVQVERKSLKYGPENRECEVRWRYREDTGISLRAVYYSSQDGKQRIWTEQHFPATGPSIPLTTTYADGAVSIDFPRGSFGRLYKQYIDIKYTFVGHESADKFQTLLYTNNGVDPAELKFDRPILAISSNKNPTECRNKNLRLWRRVETQLVDGELITSEVLVVLFYTSALEEDKGHWVEEPHYAFEWLADSIYKKESDRLTLVFSKDPSRWATDKLFKRRKSSTRSESEPVNSSLFERKRNDSMEMAEARLESGVSGSLNGSLKSQRNIFGNGSGFSRAGNLNRFGYSEFDIKFQGKKDRRAFLDVWKQHVKPLVAAP
ncbi:hypothetical protein GT037_008067 [Alternaria burnsii]|uniref:Fungal N-terminal domain-containing protein n=1 Tax=Alternaria burnsii TaxID=1187904 RepID=A0A8H7EC55_9PLEO|nr:uncharacterized protein GT037_008067 [Alternaria burnsii]KAF7674301.1 hypothetical protein GT037_008067 [Alternaria burnsii]